jgi:hypothetical protein
MSAEVEMRKQLTARAYLVLVAVAAASVLAGLMCKKPISGNPPDAPEIPSGPSVAPVDSLCTYTTVTSDPDGDDVGYRFAWGDGDTSEWTGWMPSGLQGERSHAYPSPGSFQVRAQARDVSEELSDWSGILPVVVPASWGHTYGGSEGDYAFSVQQTSDGGYIIAGQTASQGAGLTDIWYTKTGPGGSKTWDRVYGGTGYEYGRSVRETSDGGYVVCGQTASFGGGQSDVWLIKADANGDSLWTRTFGGDVADGGNSVRQTTDGGYIMVGRTESYGVGSADAWLIKTDAAGNKTWDRTFGGSGLDEGRAVEQTADGGYIIAGHTQGTNYPDVWLIKTDADGDSLWTRTFGGAYSDFGISVQQTSDGGYIVTGYTNSLGAGRSDVWLIKTDAEGNKTWDRTFGGSEDEYGHSVRQTADGGYVIAGETESFGAGASDAWLVRVGANGDSLWTRTFGGSDDEHAYAVEQTTDGGYVIVGYTKSYGAGDFDAWLIKTDENGN